MALSRRRLYLALLVAWVVLTLFLTSIPHPRLHLPFRFMDKAYHFWFYGVMGLLCALWRREAGIPAKRAVLEGLLFVAATGAIDEVHQHWIPGRSMDCWTGWRTWWEAESAPTSPSFSLVSSLS